MQEDFRWYTGIEGGKRGLKAVQGDWTCYKGIGCGTRGLEVIQEDCR